MALWIDFPAMSSLRAQADIDTVEPELANRTGIEYIGERGPDDQPYLQGQPQKTWRKHAHGLIWRQVVDVT